MVICEYDLPTQPGSFTLNLPHGNNWHVIGTRCRQHPGDAECRVCLVVLQREAQPYRHEEHEFYLARTGQAIPREVTATCPEYLGSIDVDQGASSLHLLGGLRCRPDSRMML